MSVCSARVVYSVSDEAREDDGATVVAARLLVGWKIMLEIVQAAYHDFPVDFAGEVLRPGSEGYREARQIFNMRRSQDQPALIARAADAEDVVKVMRYASERGIPVAIRSGGHGVDGTAMPDAALVLDLRLLREMSVDKATMRIKVGPGILLGDFDALGQENGLIVPSGTVSTTGVAGLTLGGGVGNMMRRFGATVDNLVSCDMVTVDGRRVRASATENPDLFWALRGGGGNFGVVTMFEYQAHTFDHDVAAGFVVFSLDQAAGLLRRIRGHVMTAPRELSIIAVLTTCPPFPHVPAELHGQTILMLMLIYSGPAENADAVIGEIIANGAPAATMMGRMPWTKANCLLDQVAPAGRRVHTRGAYLSELSDEIIEILLRKASVAPNLQSPVPATIQNIWFMGGAISEDFEEDSVAFSREGTKFFWECLGQWDDQVDDRKFEAWADDVALALDPHRRANCYVNLTTDRGPDWLRGIYGCEEKFQRLIAAKAKWDPNNLLRFNKNIPVA